MKIKNYILLLLIISGNILAAQTKGPQTCFSKCDDLNNNIFYIDEDNGVIGTNIVAQAYYWEICNQSTVVDIVGSNTNQNVTISCNKDGVFKIKLTVFNDGVCEEYCHDFTISDCNPIIWGDCNDVNFTNYLCEFYNNSNPSLIQISESDALHCTKINIGLNIPNLCKENYAELSWHIEGTSVSGVLDLNNDGIPDQFPLNYTSTYSNPIFLNYDGFNLIFSATVFFTNGTECEISTSMLIECSDDLKTEFYQIENLIQVSPNPIKENKIKFQNNTKKVIDKIEIYNHSGNLLKTISNPNDTEINFDSNHKKGIYILKFYINEKIYTKKIIKN